MRDDAVTRPLAPEAPTRTLEPQDLTEHVETEHRATPLELFFDLVFVFAFTQVTGLMSANPTWEGLGQGMLVLAAIWWAWGGYAWMTNALHRDDWLARLGLFSAMGAMLIAALAVPQAFGDDAVVFGLAYFAVRMIHIAVYAYGAQEKDVSGAILNLAPGLLAAPALLVVAGFLDGGAQAGLWIVALLIDYGTPYVRDVSGFRVSASHFAERFGLIIIIALGESIVAIGAGLEGDALTGAVIVAALAAIALAIAQWWTYFDVVAIIAERKLAEAEGIARNRLARDSWGVLHGLLIAGIILTALGVKKTVGDVDSPLETVPAVALCGGVALYLFGHVAIRWRSVHSLNRQRVFAGLLALALIPFALEVDSLAALITIAGLMVALACYEAMRFHARRSELRAAHA
ncbi:MAG: low temperature requirement protein A [Solirubrobacterales bacterium]